MINTIRSDFYRLVRSIGMYVTLAFLIAVGVAQVAPKQPGTIGVNMGDMTTQQSLTGPDTLRFLLSTDNNLVFFVIPVFVVVAGGIFSSGTVKNTLATGLSRTRLYLAKWLLASAIALVFVVVYLGSGLLATTIARGAGVWTAADVSGLTRGALAVVVILLAFTSVGIALTFWLRNGAAAWVYLGFAVIPIIAAIALSETISPEKFAATIPYNMVISMTTFAVWGDLTRPFILTALGVALAWIVVSVVGGIAAFSRAEIK